jgi:Fic family protein
LNNDIFTKKEKERLQKLQRKFINNFSKYKSQTIINKEFERIMIEFSWKSSVIEGNTYSLLGTEALIKNNVVGEGKTADETQMILNHKDAFNEAIQNKQRFVELRLADIEYIHSVLTKKLRISKNIRKEGVGITGTKYRPLDNELQIKEATQKMVGLINKKESFFEKAFLVSILIAYIQIFEDGNKRISRMISNAILLAHNSIPLSYRIVDVEEYKKAVILFYEINNISYFKQIFINQFDDAVNNYFK